MLIPVYKRLVLLVKTVVFIPKNNVEGVAVRTAKVRQASCTEHLNLLIWLIVISQYPCVKEIYI